MNFCSNRLAWLEKKIVVICCYQTISQNEGDFCERAGAKGSVRDAIKRVRDVCERSNIIISPLELLDWGFLIHSNIQVGRIFR